MTVPQAPDGTVSGVKASPDRLYGRQRGHPLRPRQQRLLDLTLPRLRLDPSVLDDPARGFGRVPSEIWLEVGFGGGEHSLAQHAAHPDVGYIASEVFENGLCSLLSRLVPDGQEGTAPVPDLLRIWDEDARILLRALPERSIDRMFLMFPDPWPKARHAKRRFVHPATIALVARVLKPGAIWRVASDDPTYQTWVSEVMGAQDLFATAPPATVRPEGWPPTRYEAKALLAGRQPLYWTFVRK
ncbi:tRNA (guanine-N(7)-)-methyltransferase [Gluconacetobacter diazotrophicus PA1 5]|uniref:tRNA (guanine-N(7)-)-methyltransferase n=2 Tax=Gluconacetobacter diazotrophicus TaxID=33996 RepID=A9HE96_GLUDA|nr:tRNA (guanine(46)-N(7))-methyltransferase TrmB [Gluconacetobacter diazotrophicus]ACI51729.1 tRNA (guanine-N(7)-)-methyltransferase [Gluconacetobacter diazotrophicus PA1 5]MBB2155231.1 tRNA (guanosine(46)-N7)-methyltransferase TrmB [Gluconacetobacter diazotrophicus]TWB11073.1 tRNA (guanine-N7-)-methyltransferase [Gluconacetobacter diazotrophicus]CAP55201.1 putative tRNA (guanine-N(7)-)-methyltransferase [Gluconacetobacter diazotrophicus PA1 5]